MIIRLLTALFSFCLIAHATDAILPEELVPDYRVSRIQSQPSDIEYVDTLPEFTSETYNAIIMHFFIPKAMYYSATTPYAAPYLCRIPESIWFIAGDKAQELCPRDIYFFSSDDQTYYQSNLALCKGRECQIFKSDNNDEISFYENWGQTNSKSLKFNQRTALSQQNRRFELLPTNVITPQYLYKHDDNFLLFASSPFTWLTQIYYGNPLIKVKEWAIVHPPYQKQINRMGMSMPYCPESVKEVHEIDWTPFDIPNLTDVYPEISPLHLKNPMLTYTPPLIPWYQSDLFFKTAFFSTVGGVVMASYLTICWIVQFLYALVF